MHFVYMLNSDPYCTPEIVTSIFFNKKSMLIIGKIENRDDLKNL
jgi:hypothetical protein